MPPVIRPNVKKRRSRRLRKKLRIAEFQRLGFDYSVVWAHDPTASQQDRFIDRFVAEVIEARGLLLGGGYTEGCIVGAAQNPTERDREAVRSWLSAFPGVAVVHLGPLVDAWYGE